MTTTNTTNKPFLIEKWRVYEAYKAVKSNQGAAGVDGQTIEAFEADLKGNLYKIWNRMSSGTYFPPPVRAVSIPKKSGGERILGVPTVSDRIAQMVVKQLIEPDLDPIFLSDSYGYRPNKSALDAVGVTRKRCWKYDWVLEFDIKGLFDNIPHDLLLKAVRKHGVAQLAEVFDHGVDDLEHARFPHKGAPANANGAQVKATAKGAVACGDDCPGDEGVVAHVEEVRGDRNQGRGDDRVAADPGAQQAQIDVENRPASEDVGGSRARHEPDDPKAEIGKAPERDDLPPGAPEKSGR